MEYDPINGLLAGGATEARVNIHHVDPYGRIGMDRHGGVGVTAKSAYAKPGGSGNADNYAYLNMTGVAAHKVQ